MYWAVLGLSGVLNITSEWTVLKLSVNLHLTHTLSKINTCLKHWFCRRNTLNSQCHLNFGKIKYILQYIHVELSFISRRYNISLHLKAELNHGSKHILSSAFISSAAAWSHDVLLWWLFQFIIINCPLFNLATHLSELSAIPVWIDISIRPHY